MDPDHVDGRQRVPPHRRRSRAARTQAPGRLQALVLPTPGSNKDTRAVSQPFGRKLTRAPKGLPGNLAQESPRGPSSAPGVVTAQRSRDRSGRRRPQTRRSGLRCARDGPGWGSKSASMSKRSGGTSEMASTPAHSRIQSQSERGLRGRRQPIPMMAIGSDAGVDTCRVSPPTLPDATVMVAPRIGSIGRFTGPKGLQVICRPPAPVRSRARTRVSLECQHRWRSSPKAAREVSRNA